MYNIIYITMVYIITHHHIITYGDNRYLST